MLGSLCLLQWTETKQLCACKDISQKQLWNRTALWSVSSFQTANLGWEIKASSTEPNAVFNCNSKHKLNFILSHSFLNYIFSELTHNWKFTHRPQLSSVQCLWNLQILFFIRYIRLYFSSMDVCDLTNPDSLAVKWSMTHWLAAAPSHLVKDLGSFAFTLNSWPCQISPAESKSR